VTAPTLYLVDASMYIFRAYYAIEPIFFDLDQKPVHAVHGFLNFLLTWHEQSQFKHALIAFDESLTSSFRNQIYPAYKANREPAPAELIEQFEYCRQWVDALGLLGLSHCEFEADDLIGSALMHMRALGYRSVIVSGDKDFTQLIGENDQIWDFAKQERYGKKGVFEKMGVHAEQVADYLALCGDSVDNIPGVIGIGAKTAAALLAHFGNLNALLERVDEIPYLRSIRGARTIANKLQTQREQASMFRQLTAIAVHAPVPEAPEQYARKAPKQSQIDQLCEQLKVGPLTRKRVQAFINSH
jgi:DNA polymerase-1